MHFLLVTLSVISLHLVVNCQSIPYIRANVARGCPACTAGKLEYKITFADAKAFAVEEMHVGSPNVIVAGMVIGNATTKCEASLTPQSLPSALEILSPFDQCGIVTTSHPNGSITYATQANVTVRYNLGGYDAYSYAVIGVPIICERLPNAPITVIQDSAEVIQLLDAVSSTFEIIPTSASSSVEKPFPPFTVAVQVVTLVFEIPQIYQSGWIIGFERCWATPTQDQTNPRNVTYISDGCAAAFGAGPSGQILAGLPDYQAQAAFLPVYFNGVPEKSKLHFHCIMNVCDKSGSDSSKCQRDCSNSRGLRLDAPDDKAKRFYTKQKEITVIQPAPYEVSRDGQVGLWKGGDKEASGAAKAVGSAVGSVLVFGITRLLMTL